MIFACCNNYLNKENSDSMKVFSRLVIAHKKAGLKINCSHMMKSYRISAEVKFHPSLRPTRNHPGVKFHLG